MNTGTATLTKTKIAEITNISPFGFWILNFLLTTNNIQCSIMQEFQK